MEGEEENFDYTLDSTLLKDFMILNDVRQLEGSRYQYMLASVDKSILTKYMKSLEAIFCHASTQSFSKENSPSDVSFKQRIKLASFANKLASEPNIVSEDWQKKIKKERRLEASKRLKEAKMSWKQKK